MTSKYSSLSVFLLYGILLVMTGLLTSVLGFQQLRPSFESTNYNPSFTRASTNSYERTPTFMYNPHTSSTRLSMAQISEPEAKKAIDKVVQALRKDSSAKSELGNLKKVENILGFGSPQKGKIAVRFNASFAKGGKGFLGMGGGKAKDGDQRGTMVGQVKASVDSSTGKVVECSVFRDLGYGRAFNLKT